jgi:nucleotide-sensitive chloride channel 1A
MKWKSQVEALYMSLSLNDAETVNEEDDIQTLEMTVLPPNYASNPETACVQDIFGAMNICADLHPDADSDDGEDLLDESAPGATGWITAENMGDFADADGNFTGMVIGDDLGPGAGTVRPRDDGAENDANGVNGHEGKYYRTG